MKLYVATFTEDNRESGLFQTIHSGFTPEAVLESVRHAIQVEADERDITFDCDDDGLLSDIRFGNIQNGPLVIESDYDAAEFYLTTEVLDLPDSDVVTALRHDAIKRIRTAFGKLGVAGKLDTVIISAAKDVPVEALFHIADLLEKA